MHYSKGFYTRTSTSTIIYSYLTRAGASVLIARANNVYIILFAPLTDSDPFKGGLFGRTCVQRQRTQSDQAKRRSYSIRGRDGTRTRSISIASHPISRPFFVDFWPLSTTYHNTQAVLTIRCAVASAFVGYCFRDSSPTTHKVDCITVHYTLLPVLLSLFLRLLFARYYYSRLLIAYIVACAGTYPLQSLLYSWAHDSPKALAFSRSRTDVLLPFSAIHSHGLFI